MKSSGRLAGVLAGLSVICIAASLLAAPRPLGSQDLLQVEWEWVPRDQLSSVQEGGWGQRGDERNGGMGDVQGSRIQLLWGGSGKATTGTNVDGRPTVPGLHTDCIPGVLRSDCSPAQEDGAWSTDAESYLNSKTGGGHLKSMQKIQDDIDSGYAARDKFLDDCLRDASLCSGRGTGGDTPRWGTRYCNVSVSLPSGFCSPRIFVRVPLLIFPCIFLRSAKIA